MDGRFSPIIKYLNNHMFVALVNMLFFLSLKLRISIHYKLNKCCYFEKVFKKTSS